jgi:hypothetical protein
MENAKHLYWLPSEFHPYVKFIVSSLSERDEKLYDMTNYELPQLPLDNGEKILENWMKSIGQKLNDEQKN